MLWLVFVVFLIVCLGIVSFVVFVYCGFVVACTLGWILVLMLLFGFCVGAFDWLVVFGFVGFVVFDLEFCLLTWVAGWFLLFCFVCCVLFGWV